MIIKIQAEHIAPEWITIPDNVDSLAVFTLAKPNGFYIIYLDPGAIDMVNVPYEVYTDPLPDQLLVPQQLIERYGIQSN